MCSIVVIKKLLGLFFIIAFTSCSKGEGEISAPGGGTSAPGYIERKVLEIHTNLPIEGATVKLQKCTKNDIVFGCTSYSLLSIYSTSTTGAYSFPSSLSIDRIDVSHPKYWSATSTGRSNISLYPEAWTKVNLKKVNNYPTGYAVSVGLANYSPFGPFNSINFLATIDTIVYIRPTGLSQNTIYWEILSPPYTIGSGGGTTASFYINKFDTASVNINY